MAKETKAERSAREAYEHTLYIEDQRVTYMPRLMSMVQRAQAANFELNVKDMAFELRDRNYGYDRELYVFDLEYSENADESLRNIEWDIERKEESEREANRKFLATQTALAKLTKEEKELLGLA